MLETKIKEVETEKITRAGLMKFLIPSLFGIIIFLLPIKDGSSFNIPLGIITEFIIGLLEAYLPTIILFVIVSSTLLSIVAVLFKPKFIVNNRSLHSLFSVSYFWLVIRILGGAFMIMTYFHIGFGFVFSESTGGVMLGLLTTLTSLNEKSPSS